jgi:hypothetical protein
MNAENQPVKTVAEFVARAVGLGKDWGDEDDAASLWFRGVSKESYDLKPRLYRLDHFDEDEIRIDFERYGRQLVEAMPQDDWDWYFLMQHFGAPTRLLDWTDGALIALHFAVRSGSKRKLKGARQRTENAAVWALDPGWLNKRAFGEDYLLLKDSKEAKYYLPLRRAGRKARPPYPIAIDPPHVARRVAVQRGHFTIHGSERKGLDTLCERSRSRLQKIPIAAWKIGDIRDELVRCGISDTTVFPDLEGLGREVMYEWTS